MSRDITATMLAAQSNPHGISQLGYAEIYPSRVYFDALTRDNSFSAVDNLPSDYSAIPQEILFNETAGLTTFLIDGGTLKYGIDGNASLIDTSHSSSIKPGVFGDKIFIGEGSNIKRYDVNWTDISNLETDPFSLEATLTPSNTSLIIHGISETECVVLGDGDGGFSIHYFSETTEFISDVRFMFPSAWEWDNEAYGKTMQEMGLYSTAFQLGSRIFVYMSNAATGIVQGIFYDTDYGVWSAVFTAIPTDLQVSLCKFQISNSFVRNGKGYLVGQFIRTDIYDSAYPYTLICSTEDGKIFSIDRFSLVSNLGYRFLGLVGSDNNLYLGNCNRICQAESTWVFDGNDDSTSPKTLVPMIDIIDMGWSDDERLSFSPTAGNEDVYDNPHWKKGNRAKVFGGCHTSIGEEYVQTGCYIIDTITKNFSDGKRSFSANCINETTWKLSGLSMPFYAEILGLSSLYDPMKEETGKLYTASSGVRTTTQFYVDFWQHEGYTNAAEGITGITLGNSGVDSYAAPGSHKNGIIILNEIKDRLNLANNPEIIAPSITLKVWGWSHPNIASQSQDTINVILMHTDKDGKDLQTVITTETTKWPATWPSVKAGTLPVTITISDLEEGRLIQRIGIIFEAANATTFCVSRIEFTSNVEVSYSLALGNTPWEVVGDGTFKVPGTGQPFIMFSQKPYNAWNFFLSSKFENTVTGGITGYATAAGLVGLAEDASNYILARYDKTSSKAQLVKVRNGIETILSDASPGWSIPDIFSMQFQHTDGHFIIRIFRDSSSQFEEVLNYDWQAVDEFIYTSEIVTKKCGIYGALLGPSARIMAFAPGVQDNLKNADGLAIDHMWSLDDFPTSGKLQIGDNLYAYTGKRDPASRVEGPWQLRNTGTYPPPFGTGQKGLECRLFDWTASPSLFTSKFIAINNGSVFIQNGSTWKIFITTGGVKQYLYNRSRHYSSNTQIAKMGATTNNKVWLGLGGFTGVSLLSGNSARQSEGEFAVYSFDGEIKCFWFMGVGGESDTTIENLVDTTIHLCGGRSSFPGNIHIASLEISEEEEIVQDDYSEGFDMEFELESSASFEIRTNIKIKPDNYEEVNEIQNDTGTKIVFDDLGSGNYAISLLSTSSDTVMYKYTYTSGVTRQNFRILYYENNISIYHNFRWVGAIAFDELIYTQTNYVSVSLFSSTPLTFENIYIKDMSDWREAVYIDLETDGNAAIGSIIQERPIESIPTSDGGLSFFYEMERPQLTLLTDPYDHTITEAFPSQGASDAIIYGSKDVKTIHSNEFAADIGFSTKLMRLPDLNVGGLEVAFRTLKREFENSERHDLNIRPDLRITPGDVLLVDYNLSGSSRSMNYSIIIENISFRLKDRMNISGRKYIG